MPPPMVGAKPKTTSILALVHRTIDLPTVPEVLTRLSEVIASEDSTADDVADVISQDAAVATHVLRIVNAPYHGLQVDVSSISLAVSVLGFSMTKKIALEAAIYARFASDASPVPRFDPRAFWQHAVYAGVAARAIGAQSQRLGGHHGEDLFICGLLHDIGKVVLLERAPSEYGHVLATCARSGRPQSEVEAEVFGFTHADVGSVLAVKWFLPEDMTIAIRYHHHPQDDPFHRPLSSLLHLADHLACGAGRPAVPGLDLPKLDARIHDAIGIDARQVTDLLPLVESHFGSTGLPL